MAELPIFITEKNRPFYAIGAICYSTAIYQAANALPFGQPFELPILWFDQHFPFIPEFFWIYITEYLLFLVAIIYFRRSFEMCRYFYAFLFHQTIAVAIFLLWPTTFPRHLWPVPDTFSGHALGWFRANLDEPNNCLPSLHVASSYMTALALAHFFRKTWFWLTWGSLIAVSTLFTKQHSILDVITGVAFGFVTYWVFFRWVKYYRPKARKRGAQATR